MPAGRMTMAYKGKRQSGRSLAPAAKKEVSKMVERKLDYRLETKFYDKADTEFPDNAVGDVIPLTDIAQATTASSDSVRIGDELHIKSLEMRLSAAAGVLAGVTTPTVLRCIIVQWHGQFSVDAPSIGKIFGAIGSVNTSPLRPYNHDNRKKFRVLYDRQLELGYNSDSIHTWKIKLNKKFRKTQYYAGSTTDQKEGLYMILLSTVDILGVLPSVSYVSRVNFKDA